MSYANKALWRLNKQSILQVEPELPKNKNSKELKEPWQTLKSKKFSKPPKWETL